MNRPNRPIRPIRSFAVLPAFALALSTGCAAMPKGPGFIDPRMAAAAQEPGAKEIELVLDPGGAITKVAVEHATGDKTPEALRKLVEATFPGGTLLSYEQEMYSDGAVVHEVEVKTADGKECEVSASEAGALRYTECKLKPEELGEPIKKAIEAATPGAQVKEAELRKGGDGSEELRVEVTSGGRTFYLRIKPDGTLVERFVVLEAEVTIPLK